MADIRGPLTDVGRKETAEALQASVVDMIDLSLVGKQMHWHVQGPRFRDVHLQLDVVVEIARRFQDILAERAISIGAQVDGRSGTVSRETQIQQAATGYLRDDDVVDQMAAILVALGERLQRRIDTTEDTDPTSQDFLIAAAQEIQEQAWWFQALSA